MHRVEHAHPRRETDNLGRREAAEETEAEEERLRVAEAVQSPGCEREDITAMASIAAQPLHQRMPAKQTTVSQGLGLCATTQSSQHSIQLQIISNTTTPSQ
jgi:hypothetical protein